MTLGFSIFLLAVGAILAFAVNATLAGIDIHVVGWILMAAGLLGLVVSLVIVTPRRRREALTASGLAYRVVAPSTDMVEPTVVEQTRTEGR